MPQAAAGGTDDPGSLGYEIDITHPKCRGDLVYGAMTFFRNKNPNGLAPELHQDDEGEPPWLRLAVARNAYRDATEGDPERCDRCELRDTKLSLGTAVWYSFEMRAEQGFPVVDARCVCAQIKAPYYDADGGSPLFALRIDRGRYLATIEHLYEIKDTEIIGGAEISRHVRPYPGPAGTGARALDHHVFGNTARDFKELQVRAVLATDSRGLQPHLEGEFRWCTDLVSVTSGISLPDDIFAWRRFTVRVAPTCIKDQDGILQLWVDDAKTGADVLVAEARGEFGHAGYLDPTDNDGPAPGDGLQYFKIGPYRDKIRIWGGDTAAIHVRNIKRGSWEDGAKLRAALSV
jgi:hypothetical protein